jgi:lipopolysaccharide biosynthesis glycosyltransferase
MAIFFFALFILSYIAIIIQALPPTEKYPSPIHIGLAVDEKSSRDLLIVINSARKSAYDLQELAFHVIACGSDLEEAKLLAKQIDTSIKNCFPSNISVEIVPFTLPRESGFYLQMINSKHKSHWSSSTGADMARFYISSLFPSLDRILYVDNDVLITCCLEEIWVTHMASHQLVGVALDDLKWATVTQFQRQYNASHPLVAKNIRRESSGDDHKPVTQEEFWKALPRYPNDGVLLFDVQKYNAMKILDALNEIAMANGHGDYVVGLGTQQFTVLGMHDRWVELTPRANLRHFPDMARGYLMWFLYNGLIHYAGAAKPRQLCLLEGKVENEHRLRTYVPWASNVLELNQRCPNERSIQADECWRHIPEPKHRIQYLDLVEKVVQNTRDPSLVHLKIGKPYSAKDMTHDAYLNSLACFPQKSFAEVSSMDYRSIGLPSVCDGDLVSLIERYVLHNSSWSARIYHNDNDSVRLTEDNLSSIKYNRHAAIRTSYLNDIKRRPQKKKNPTASREWLISSINYCRYLTPVKSGQPRAKHDEACVSILDDIRIHKKRHWDVVTVVIDAPPSSLYSFDSSLSILRALDLEFIRSNLLVVKLYSDNLDKLQQDIDEAKGIINRNGFILFHDHQLIQPTTYDQVFSATLCGSMMSIFDLG